MSGRLKIAWFTPAHPSSAIGEFSKHVTPELAKLADVELWVSEDGSQLSTELPVIHYAPGSSELDRLSQSDIIVYNMGNYLGYHGDMYRVSILHPGVVILHDRALHHLFADMWLMGEGCDPVRYIERMGAYYGTSGVELARESLQGKRRPVWESDGEILRYPLYEEGIANALGVVTHSVGQAAEIRLKWLGPVLALNLPCYRDALARAANVQGGRARDRLRLLTMGHLNPNKQVDRVIKMLVEDPELASRVEYRVVGPDGGFTSYSRSLRRLVAQHADVLSVEILDWLPDGELERELASTDIFVNLRNPNIEGSSASLMKQLAFGRPVLCFDSGFFGEVPDGAVRRVPVGDFGAVAESVRELAVDASLRERIGAAGRAFAERCSERSYAAGLLELIDSSTAMAPALELLDLVSRELGDMSIDSNLPIFDDIAADFGRVLGI